MVEEGGNKKDTNFAFKGTACYVGVSEHAHTRTEFKGKN